MESEAELHQEELTDVGEVGVNGDERPGGLRRVKLTELDNTTD